MMPANLVNEARWWARLFKRPSFVTKREDDDGELKWRARSPYDGQPEWDEGETAVMRYDEDGTETKL
jgi:hypothetical protein